MKSEPKEIIVIWGEDDLRMTAEKEGQFITVKEQRLRGFVEWKTFKITSELPLDAHQKIVKAWGRKEQSNDKK